MYAIAHLIYGHPLVTNDAGPSPRARWPRVDAAIEDEVEGFLTYYSGAADETPAAFGIRLGHFDEACAFVPLSDIPLAPTDEQKAQYEAQFAALAPELQDDLRSLGSPAVFLLWSTS